MEKYVPAEFKDLIGETFVSVTISKSNDEIEFLTESGKLYKLYHNQDCCEQVEIEEIHGDLDDLIGYKVVWADEATSEEVTDVDWSQTWTFYRIQTHAGFVSIRWLGTSNGFYSESVDFVRVVSE